MGGVNLVTHSLWMEYCSRDGILLLRLSCKDTVASILCALSCSFACSLWWKPVRCCEPPYGEANMAKNQRRLSANSQQETEALSSTVCEGLSLVNNHVSELENWSSLSQAFMWEPSLTSIFTVASERPQKHLAKHSCISDIHKVYDKSANVGVIFYSVIEHQYKI